MPAPYRNHGDKPIFPPYHQLMRRDSRPTAFPTRSSHPKGFPLSPLVIPTILRIPADTMIFDVLSKLHSSSPRVCLQRRKGARITMFRIASRSSGSATDNGRWRKQIADIHLFPILHKGRSAKPGGRYSSIFGHSHRCFCARQHHPHSRLSEIYG